MGAEIKHPTLAQCQRLYAIGTANGWSKPKVVELMMLQYKVDSSKKLSMEQYNQLVDFLLTSPAPNVATMKQDAKTENIF